MVCSLVGTFVMFYEEETSPLPGWGRRPSCKETFFCNCWVCCHTWWQTEHAFGADALFGEDIHPFFRTMQADQAGCHACPMLLVRNVCCFHKAGDWCLSSTGKRATKKKETRKRGRKNISSRADCKFWAKESTISEPKGLRPFPFLCAFFELLRRRQSWALPCVCTLTSSACAGWHLNVFGCQKQTWKRHSRLTILSGNLAHYSG